MVRIQHRALQQRLKQSLLIQRVVRAEPPLEQQSLNQTTAHSPPQATQGGDQSLPVAGIQCFPDHLLGSCSLGWSLNSLQQQKRPGPERTQEVPAPAVQAIEREPTAYVAGQQPHRQPQHQLLRNGEQQAPVDASAQALGLVIDLQRWPGDARPLHPQGSGGWIPVINAALPPDTPGMSGSENPIGNGRRPLQGMGRDPGERRLRSSGADAQMGGMGDHSQGRCRQELHHHPLSFDPGTEVLVIKSISHQHFVESPHLIHQAAIQQPLPRPSIRTAAKGSKWALRCNGQRSWCRHCLRPAIGIQLQQTLTDGQLNGEVVGPAEMPLALTFHPHKSDPGILRQIPTLQRLITAPVENQMFLVMWPAGHCSSGDQQMRVPVHADRHNAEGNAHSMTPRVEATRFSRALTAAR